MRETEHLFEAVEADPSLAQDDNRLPLVRASWQRRAIVSVVILSV